MCDATKSVHYSVEVVKCGKDQHKLYQLVRKLTEGERVPVFPECESDQKLSEDFSIYFIDKIDKIMVDVEKIIETEQITSLTYDKRTVNVGTSLSSFKLLSYDDIMKLINASKTKSSILDPIPTHLLKECIDVLIYPIADIVNNSLREGQFPECWKCPIVSPLLKKAGLEPTFKNYRPVSNLSFVSKVIEKAALSQYTTYAESIGMVSSNNSAYKKKNSTETLLIKIHSDILNNMDQQKVTLLVLLDLSSAFDTVSLEILTDIFSNKFNINGNVLNWFQTYLRDRSQRVKINEAISDAHKTKFGVPQGSCAGPVVFLGYLTSLYEVIEKHLPQVRVGGYADDHQLYISYNPGNNDSECDAIDRIEKCIIDVRSWMLAHRLKINDSKTELMLIGTSQQLKKVNIRNVTVGQTVIAPATSIRNLGVLFDSHMNMTDHVNAVCKRGYHQLRKIRQIRKYLNKSSAEEIVHSFITSNIDYCNALLYGVSQCVINKLQKLQNSAARVICGARKYDHVRPLLMQLHWLPIVQRVDYKIALMTFKCLNNLAPDYLSELVMPYNPGRSLRSSNQLLLKVPRCRTKTLGPRAFTSSAPQVWNRLPESVRRASSVDIFKKELKTFLFKEAFGDAK